MPDGSSAIVACCIAARQHQQHRSSRAAVVEPVAKNSRTDIGGVHQSRKTSVWSLEIVPGTEITFSWLPEFSTQQVSLMRYTCWTNLKYKISRDRKGHRHHRLQTSSKQATYEHILSHRISTVSRLYLSVRSGGGGPPRGPQDRSTSAAIGRLRMVSYIYIYIYVYVYIYICREREIDIDIDAYIYIYTYTCVYIYMHIYISLSLYIYI